MRYDLDDLLTLMQVLRDPEQGCPWDIKQGWDSIVPHTLEEAYEVADAIERRAFDSCRGSLAIYSFKSSITLSLVQRSSALIFTISYIR